MTSPAVDPNLVVDVKSLQGIDTASLVPITDNINGHLITINDQILGAKERLGSKIIYDMNNNFPVLEGLELSEVQTIVLVRICRILTDKGYNCQIEMPQGKSSIKLDIRWDSKIDKTEILKYKKELAAYVKKTK